jgi:hypothetical protein
MSHFTSPTGPLARNGNIIYSHGRHTRQAASALSFTPHAMDEIGIELHLNVGDMLFCSSH